MIAAARTQTISFTPARRIVAPVVKLRARKRINYAAMTPEAYDKWLATNPPLSEIAIASAQMFAAMQKCINKIGDIAIQMTIKNNKSK